MARAEPLSYTEALDLIERERRRVPRIELAFARSRLAAPRPVYRRSGSLELTTLTINPTLRFEAYEARTVEGTLSWATLFSLSFAISVGLEIDEQLSPLRRSIYRPTWVTRLNAEVQPDSHHVRGHLDGWSNVLRNLEGECYGELRRTLPSPAAPVGVAAREVERFLQATGSHWAKKVERALWDESCNWDQRDYPRLQQIIGSGGPRLGRPVACQLASRVRVPARPGPPVAVHLRRRPSRPPIR